MATFTASQATDDLDTIRVALEEEYDLTHGTGVAEAFDRLSAFIRGDSAENIVESLQGYGEKIKGVRYGDGKRARIGDHVEVSGSSRYGTATGRVRGPATSSDDKTRVTVKLDNGLNDEYAPSVGRIRRLEKAASPNEE